MTQPLKLRLFFFFLVQLANELFLFRARMGNIRGWGGPLPPSWYKIQLDLQRKILTAMRNLGMAPVLPGFAGFVPDGLKRVYPQAKLSRVSRWVGFNNTYRCTYHLHSTDPLFKVLVSDSCLTSKKFMLRIILLFHSLDLSWIAAFSPPFPVILPI